jgi:metallo-beta-lactamase family protein
VVLRSGGRTVVFSGDLGRYDDLVMHAPAAPPAADCVIVESTYGDRLHPDADPVEMIADALRRTVDRGGILLVPSFAVGRAQTILYCLHEAFRRELAPRVPVFVNSPMATDATDLYVRFADAHGLSVEQCREVFGAATFTRSVEASRELTERRDPAVILSASGMATGGRVLHHLKALLPDPRHTVLMPGFQAPGTRGEALAHGARQVKIHGRYVPVHAEVMQIDVLSAHGDQADLLRWLMSAPRAPGRVVVTHGEPAAADELRRRAHEALGVETHVAEWDETLELG